MRCVRRTGTTAWIVRLRTPYNYPHLVWVYLALSFNVQCKRILVNGMTV